MRTQAIKKLKPVLTMLIADIIAYVGAALLDSRAAAKAAASGSMGHAAPAWTIFVFLLFGAITAVVVVISVIRFISALVQNRKNEGKEEYLSDLD